MSFPYSQQNNESRLRLEALVQGLSEEDLACTTDYGWSVAALLAHLAVWDTRMSAILRRWQEEGLDPSPMDADAVNEAIKPLCHALEPRTAAELAVKAARQIDAELETVPMERVAQIEVHAEATSTQFRMNRSLHRAGHLNDIEALLGKNAS